MLRGRDTEALCEVLQYIPQCYNKMYWSIHETNKQFEITYKATVCWINHYNGAGNSDITWFCRCRYWSKLWVWNWSRWSALRLRSFTVTPCSLAVRYSIPTDRKWKRIRQGAVIRGVHSARCKGTLNTDLAYRTALCSFTRNRSVVALTVSRWLFFMYLLSKYKIFFRWCSLYCTWYVPSIFSSTLSTTSHSLNGRLLNLHLQ